MSFDRWLWFISSTFLISATPGSNMLLAFQFGLNYGFKKTLWVLAGLSCGLLILLMASLLGISLLSQHAPTLFMLMKLVGAAYLAYLGLQIWQHADSPMGKREVEADLPKRKLFQTGVAVSLSNPKAILFFAAFFPKFLNTALPMMPQYAVLTLSFFVIEIAWQLAYTVGGQSLSAWLQQGRRLLWLNRGCAVVFIGIALGLIYETVGSYAA